MVERELQNGGKKVNATKTSLTKLKVNVLRDLLERAGSDPRGNKGALVERILDEMRKEQENTDIRSVSKHLSEGLALRKQIVKFSKLKDLHAGKGKVPLSQADLEQAQESATSEVNVFSKVFSGPDEVAQLLVDAKAGDVVMINVMGKCTFTDYMVIASGRSHQMVRMLAEAILYELKKRCKEVAPGVFPSIEGSDDPTPEWLVVDAGSVVVHVFHEDARSEYNLEGLWGNETNTTRVAVPYTNVTTLNTIQ
jgi:ribosome silencing factor RsfS/YbeB/iojap